MYGGSNYDCSVVDVGAADTNMGVPSAAVHACVAGVSMRLNGAVKRVGSRCAALELTSRLYRGNRNDIAQSVCGQGCAMRRAEKARWAGEIGRSSIEVAGVEKPSRMPASMLRPVTIVVAQQR